MFPEPCLGKSISEEKDTSSIRAQLITFPLDPGLSWFFGSKICGSKTSRSLTRSGAATGDDRALSGAASKISAL